MTKRLIPRFSRKESQEFFQTLNKRVNQYFKDNKLAKTGNWKLYLKSIVMFTILIAPFVLILYLNINELVQAFAGRGHWYWHGRSGHECDARRKPRFLFQTPLDQ